MQKGPAMKTGLLILPSDAPTDKTTTLTPLTIAPTPSTPLHLLYTNTYTNTPPTKTLVSIVQIHQFTQDHGSWILVPDKQTQPPHLCQNGNLTIITKIDPVFLAIAVLEAHRNLTGNDVRQPLSDLSQMPDGTDLSTLITHDHLAHICEVRHALDDRFYRLSDHLVLAWLARKYQILVEHPRVGLPHAFELVSQYLTLDWEARFQSFLQKHPTLKPSPSADHTAVDPEAAQLAMSAMMDEARASNTAERVAARTSNEPGKKKTPKKPSKPPVKPSSSALNFWAKRQTRQTDKNNTDKKDKSAAPSSSSNTTGKRKR